MTGSLHALCRHLAFHLLAGCAAQVVDEEVARREARSRSSSISTNGTSTPPASPSPHSPNPSPPGDGMACCMLTEQLSTLLLGKSDLAGLFVFAYLLRQAHVLCV